MSETATQLDAAAPTEGHNPLEWAATHLLAAKIQAKHIANYNGANLAYGHACDMANKLGLTETQKARIVPFPSPTNVIVANSEQQSPQQAEPAATPQPGAQNAQQASTFGTLGKIALAAILGAGSVPVAWGAWNYYTSDNTPPPVIEQPLDPELGEMGYKVY